MKRDNIESYRLPFTVEEVLDELRMVLWCTASQVALAGRVEAAEAIIAPEAEFGFSETPARFLPMIDLESFPITRILKDAYDFAFQVNEPARFSGMDWADLMAFVKGCVRSAWSGEIAPPCRADSVLLHVADMVQGRMDLLMGGALSIRQLALLAHMTEAAVRSALSADGIKTEGRPASLPAAKAEVWLRGRRGFVPTADGAAIKEIGSGDAIIAARPFPEAFRHLVRTNSESPSNLAEKAGVDINLIEALLRGETPDAGARSLARIAAALDLEAEPFVGLYMRHAMT